MESNTLGAFVVKRRKVLLPVLTNRESDFHNTGWVQKRNINKGILIEAHEETVNGYTLYGTEIPIIFSYPHFLNDSVPKMAACIGVETRQWAISYVMQMNYPDGRFHYKGKYITDEDVIAWLENEDNIESMKRVKEWALRYGEECKVVQEEIKARRLASYKDQKEIRRIDEEQHREKVKRMIDRRNQLINKYNNS